MQIYLSNAFSFNMVAESSATMSMTELSAKEAGDLLLAPEGTWGWLGTRAISPTVAQAVGHTDTAALFGRLLDLDGITPTRRNVTLSKGDVLILGQYSGPRLPEGATTLPEGATIRWLKVTLV